MKKRVLSLLLVLCMVATIVVVPATAAAETIATTEAFVAAVAKGGAVQLTADVTLDSAITVNSDVALTIDLNGNTLSYTADVIGEAMITNRGTLTITDTSSAKNGKVVYTYTGAADTSYGKGNYTISNVGTLTLNAGMIENATAKLSHACYAVDNNSINSAASLTVNGGKILNTNNFAIRQIGGNHKNDVTVNDGVIEGTRAIWIQLPSSNASVAPDINLTVNGGTLTATKITSGGYDYKLAIYSYSYGNDFSNVDIDITGGTINGDIFLTTTSGAITGIEKLTVTGGEFSGLYGEIYSYGDNALAQKAITIKGGTFATDGAAYYAVDDGCYFFENADGSYNAETLGASNAAAMIGDEFYLTLEEALEVGGNITLLNDVEIDSLIMIEKGITLDLNNKTVTSTAQKAFEIHTTEKVTIKNGTIIADKRAVDTRVNAEVDILSCTLKSSNTNGTNVQPLTIGGATHGTKILIKDSVIDGSSNKDSYAIISFVKTDLTIDNSTVKGWAALYLQDDTAGSNVVIRNNSVLLAHNTNSGLTNDFEAITIQSIAKDPSVKTTVSITDSTITATQSGSADQYAIGFGNYQGHPVKDCEVTISGDSYVAVKLLGISEGTSAEDNALIISGGYFADDPSAYLADGKGLITSDNAGYAYKVGEKTAADVVVVPSTGAATVKPAEENASQDVKDATTAAAGTTVTGLDEAAAEVAQQTTVSETEMEEIVAELSTTTGGAVAAEDVVIHVQTSLDIEVKAADTSSSTKFLTVDITPVAQVIASTSTSASDVKTEGDDKNAAVISEKKVEITEPVTVSIPLPAGFAADGDKILVIHKKDSGEVYTYEATVTANVATFVNPNGFSEFILTDNTANALQAAAEAVGTGKIVLSESITSTDRVLTVKGGMDIILDLNGKDITSSYDPYTIDVQVGGKLSIIGQGTISNTSAGSTTIRNYGLLTIGETGKAGPTVTRSVTTNNAGNSAVKNEENSTLVIYSGTFIGDKRSIQSWGSTGIYGGTFKKAVEAWEWTEGTTTYESTLFICGGTFESFVGFGGADGANTVADVTIIGGVFVTDVSLYVAEGYVQHYNGIVLPITYGPVVDVTPKPEVGFTCNGGFGCVSSVYSDVDTKQWYHEGIDFVTATGLMTSMGNGKFGINENTSRGMIVTILYRMAGAPYVFAPNPFTDVEGGKYYTDAVLWAYHNGIVSGYGGSKTGTFGPNDPITREQLAVMLFNFSEYTGYDVSKSANVLAFADGATVSGYAYSAMQWAYAEGLISGVSTAGSLLLDPQGYAVRSQVASVIMRLCKNISGR